MSAAPTADLRAALARPLAWAGGFSLAINLALLAPSLFMLQVYDRVLVTRSVETLAMLGGLTVATLVLFGLLDHARARLLALVGMGLERRLGPALLAQAIVACARQAPGAVHEGLRDLATLRGFLAGPGIVSVFDAPWALVYLLLVTAFDVRLGLLASASVALLLGVAMLNHRWVRRGLAQVHEGSRAGQRLAERALQNAEVVTALGMSDTLSARWLSHAVRTQELTLASSARTGGLNSFSRTVRQCVQVAMMALGAWLVIGDGVTPGVMIATTIILGRALAPVEQLIGGWQALAEARGAHARLRELLAARPAGDVATALPRPQGRLAVEALAYAAPGTGRPLLRGVSFALAPGELLALVGPSGAGKTTLARLLAGVLRPAAGAVRLDGADLRQFDPRALGPALGYVPQDVELFDGTVAENIARFTVPGEGAVVAAARAAGAHALILRLPQGYDTPVGDAGRLLSGGQRQRVALARALFGDPAFVVLDEPDASLDAEGEEALVAALQGLRARGATVVAVTQRRRLLGLADRVLVLRDGLVERTLTRADETAASSSATAAAREA
jgi:PrtD family type I secretion system ABC transporter